MLSAEIFAKSAKSWTVYDIYGLYLKYFICFCCIYTYYLKVYQIKKDVCVWLYSPDQPLHFIV